MIPEGISLRQQTDDDLPFARLLYGSTRAEEMEHFPFNEQQKVEFLDQQFQAQWGEYSRYPNAEFLIIEKGGEPIGRLYLDRLEDDICIIDIALLPGHRGGGVGRALIEEVFDEARGSGRTVSIYVEMYNPARHLYDRLGFQEIDTVGVYKKMIWTPDGRRVAPNE